MFLTSGLNLDGFIKNSKDYRSYRTPPGYVKWSELLIKAAPSIVSSSQIYEKFSKDSFLPPVDQQTASAAQVAGALQTLTPPICVHENIIPALLQTNVKSMDPPEYAFPFFIFLFPSNFKTLCGLPDDNNGHSTDYQAAFVSQIAPASLGSTLFTKANTTAYGVYEWLDPFNETDDNAKEEDFILEKVIKNLVLTYTYESKYYTEEIIERYAKGQGFSSDNTSKPFQVRWLGKNYTQTRQRIVYKSNKESTEESRVVRSHWRRGHWHTVCCGTGRKARKQQWFKPVLVNAG